MMSETFNELRCWGCKIDTALNRLVNDEELFLDCIRIFAQEDGFEKLETHITNQEYSEAFATAHTLKGVAGNLSLMPLYDSISAVVEALRNKDYQGLENMYSKVMGHFESFKKIVKNTNA